MSESARLNLLKEPMPVLRVYLLTVGVSTAPEDAWRTGSVEAVDVAGALRRASHVLLQSDEAVMDARLCGDVK
jgi:hypothetical protein